MSSGANPSTNAKWQPAIRLDRGSRIAKLPRTASGGVRVEGVVARAGIYTYQRADGVTRELLPPEEAARIESLATLRDAPVTVGHPAGRMVSPSTYRSDSVGHVSGQPTSDGKIVKATLAVQDEDAIARIDAGELVELSPGYRLQLDPTPGVWNGQRYDAVQRCREYNHLAIGPSGWARGGAETSLRVDGVDDVAIEIDAPSGESTHNDGGETPRSKPAMKTERIDGIEYEVGSVAHSQARARFDAAQTAKLAELEKRAKDAETRADEATARAEVATKEAAASKKALEEAIDPKRIDALVTARVELVERARKVLGADEKLDGKTDREIMLAAIAKLDPELDLSKRADEAVRVHFDAAIKWAPEAATSPLARDRRAAVGEGADRTDAIRSAHFDHGFFAE